MILEDLGFEPYFSAQFALLAEGTAWVPARIGMESHGLYELHGCSSKLGELSGRLRRELGARERPTTGDWVLVAEDGTGGHAIIHQVLERRTLLKRRAAFSDRTQLLAANVDRFFIVTSATSELNERRLERYLTAVWDSGADPVVLLNKIDLVEDPSSLLAAIERVALDTPVVALSALSGTGFGVLESYLEPKKTVAFIGSSGVGKSSLANRLLALEDPATPASLATQATGWDAKGRHTTSSRQLLVIPGKGVLLDTPGMRELGMVEDAGGLHAAFADLATLARECRFRDCRHRGEPGCAVARAVETGKLAAERVSSFHKLEREIEAAERRQDPVLAANTKRRWKAISKHQRRRKR